MGKKSIVNLILRAAFVWLFFACFTLDAFAEVTASIRTNKIRYVQGEAIATWIALHVSEAVLTDEEFFQQKFELRIDVRGPNKEKIIARYYQQAGNFGEDEPKPMPPKDRRKILEAGDYEVILEDLNDHYDVAAVGPYSLRFVTSLTIYDESGNADQKTVSSQIKNLERVMAHTIAVDIEPNTLNKKSKGKSISAYISAFPESFGAADVLGDSVQLWHSGQHVLATRSNIQKSILMVKFDRAAVLGMLGTVGEMELELRGQFANGQLFQGTDTVKVK